MIIKVGSYFPLLRTIKNYEQQKSTHRMTGCWKMNRSMTWNPFMLIFLFLSITFFHFATADLVFLHRSCSHERSSDNSPYQTKLKTLLSSLSSNATPNANGFYNNTILGTNSSDTVYGLFMCRGDVLFDECRDCVANATHTLSSDTNCSLSKSGVIWYDECMVRFSNNSFFSTVDTYPRYYRWNQANISSNPLSFNYLLANTMRETAHEAANSSNRYSTKKESLSEFNTLYCLTQCTQDLSPQQCSDCLESAISDIPSCCDGKQGGRVVYPSCNIRYELYPFYRATDEGPKGLVPETKYAQRDSEYSENPAYISHNCSNNKAGIAFQSNLRTLLSAFSSKATSRYGFQTQEGTAYGLFRCRIDIPARLCQQCIQNATDRITSECGLASAEAVIWYNHCWLRYSARNFFSSYETSPRFGNLNISNSSPIQSSVASELSNQLAKVANMTGNTDNKFLTDESLRLNDEQRVYILGQCSTDLSTDGCSGCLNDVIGTAIPWSSLGSVGGRVLYPSCILRFELFQFYNLTPPPPPSPPGQMHSKTIILIITSSIVVSGVFFTLCYYLIRRKPRKNSRTILQENFGQESSTIESLQFNLPTIETATNNFSYENKIGKGGFGEVYKGILYDGRSIAVKRLSRNSKQGIEEFKNEVLLIAKLQHRNLVAFIGFYLDEQEKILIYEYVPNKSLDYFLFDTKQEKVLSWSERHNIIGGIARGILYLHEHSRLKVIHRDLKPSNVLLDENMNPNISDFGLARIVEIDQEEESTNRIIGTYGYMSPEYALFGQFSEKSDVYSFGVMILEIITGKKNIGSYESHRVADGLLNFVWRNWRDEATLNILDPKLKENYSNVEVMRCIQIGLLCVQENSDSRPTMVTIASYLSSHTIELPSPQEPTFFLNHIMNPIVAHESSSGQDINSIPSSINDISISEFYPR
ncbi:cysteine-rich receptor-like protein kinase 7 isoform X2 [Vigna unguiculata]|uniref:cysteine-rich receptor-like protein kinase 7 isoform X2 n=1 Tax=Vigna unguiculata TaxID=3917 RepID=UPI001015D976|nr:cysteine-rich receptor-like protein kinase 7 isoform X2 [Vigna unguiculata]